GSSASPIHGTRGDDRRGFRRGRGSIQGRAREIPRRRAGVQRPADRLRRQDHRHVQLGERPDDHDLSQGRTPASRAPPATSAWSDQVTTFPGSPKILKGGIVLLDPRTSAVRRVIPLQYNPDSISRTLQAQSVGGENSDRSETLRLKGPPVETIRLEAELD